MTKLEWALEHAKRGWRVFPLRPGEKTPYGGFKWKLEASCDEARIRKWWGERPESNIAVATGAGSGITVVDVDDVDEFRFNCPADTLGEMYKVFTPSGGYHVYFRYGRFAQTGVKRLPGADIRNDGGYVVAAGSEGYELKDGILVEMPEWMHSVGEAKENVREARPDADIPLGQRNQFLTEAAGRLQRLDVLSFVALNGINIERCNPPVPDYEVKAIVNSVRRYSPEEILAAPSLEPVFIEAKSLATEMLTALADKTTMAGKPTCFEGLNKLLGGGFRTGELNAIHAPGKRGKSSLVHQLIKGYLDDGLKIGYASREMRAADEVLPNLMSIAFQENAWLEEMTNERRERYARKLSGWDLYFTPGFGPYPIDRFEVWVTQLKSLGVDYYFVDHLHYCLEDPEDHKEVVKLAQAFKRIANEKDVGIICIMQPVKIMEGTRMSQATLRGGAGVGQALDGLLTLERHIDPNTNQAVPNHSELEVVDIRHKLGKRGKIYLQYNPETTTIEEVEIRYENNTNQNRLASVL